MSTTTELLAANERYDKLRAAILALADEWVHGFVCEWGCDYSAAYELRALLDDQETNR